MHTKSSSRGDREAFRKASLLHCPFTSNFYIQVLSLFTESFEEIMRGKKKKITSGSHVIMVLVLTALWEQWQQRGKYI